MTKYEALRLALEALEGVLDDSPKVLDASISGGLYEVVQCRDAITAIKAALEAKDEPVDLNYQPDWKEEYQKAVDLHCITLDELREANVTRQRTWVGLTNEDISEIVRGTHNTGSFVRAIQAKLKEKNT